MISWATLVKFSRIHHIFFEGLNITLYIVQMGRERDGNVSIDEVLDHVSLNICSQSSLKWLILPT